MPVTRCNANKVCKGRQGRDYLEATLWYVDSVVSREASQAVRQATTAQSCGSSGGVTMQQGPGLACTGDAEETGRNQRPLGWVS